MDVLRKRRMRERMQRGEEERCRLKDSSVVASVGMSM